MKETALPYPGVINNGDRLRVEVVKAISSLEVSVNPATGKHSEADNLKAFLDAASTYVNGLVAAADPVNTVAPAVTGTAKVGSVLTSTAGTWTGATATRTYAWFRSNPNQPSGFERITGATAATYTPVAGDIGKTIRSRVQAANADGEMLRAFSNTTAAVVA